METPSDRVLASWREHAREGWYFESYKHFPQRIIMGLSMTEEDIRRFQETLRADVYQLSDRMVAW